MARYRPRYAAVRRPARATRDRRAPHKVIAGVALGLTLALGAGPIAQADYVGHDISRWQGDINVRALGAAVIVKQSGSDTGRFYVDPKYVRNADAVRAAGKQLGHYYYNGFANPVAAANSFVDNLRGYRPGDPLVYDAEESRFVSPAAVQAWVQQVRARLGSDANVYVYMSSSVTRAYNWSSVAASGVKLWVANYGVNNGRQNGSGPSVGYWAQWLIWQYTSVGRVSGYSGNLDANLIRAAAWGGGQTTSVVLTPASSTVPHGSYLGYDIAETQRLLNANGATLVVDSYYGAATRAAVVAFQSAHGLTADGYAGPATQAALRGQRAAPSALIGVDGWIGAGTITRAQQIAGTPVDGVLSGQTRANLARAYRLWSATRGTGGSMLVAGLQSDLKATGYYHGTIDGHWGRLTTMALQRNLRAKGVYTGQIDGWLGWKTADGWQRILNTGHLI